MDTEDLVLQLRLSPSLQRASSPGSPPTGHFVPITARTRRTDEDTLAHARRIFGFEKDKKDESMTPEQIIDYCLKLLMLNVADDVKAIATLYLNSTKIQNKREEPRRKEAMCAKLNELHKELMKLEMENKQLKQEIKLRMNE